jgi:hypothetical protein
MIGYILTEEQKNQIQGQEFAPFERFNCVQDINDVCFNFVTEQQIPLVKASQYAWVLTLPQGEYIPKPSPFPFNETN